MEWLFFGYGLLLGGAVVGIAFFVALWHSVQQMNRSTRHVKD